MSSAATTTTRWWRWGLLVVVVAAANGALSYANNDVQTTGRQASEGAWTHTRR